MLLAVLTLTKLAALSATQSSSFMSCSAPAVSPLVKASRGQSSPLVKATRSVPNEGCNAAAVSSEVSRSCPSSSSPRAAYTTLLLAALTNTLAVLSVAPSVSFPFVSASNGVALLVMFALQSSPCSLPPSLSDFAPLLLLTMCSPPCSSFTPRSASLPPSLSPSKSALLPVSSLSNPCSLSCPASPRMKLLDATNLPEAKSCMSWSSRRASLLGMPSRSIAA